MHIQGLKRPIPSVEVIPFEWKDHFFIIKNWLHDHGLGEHILRELPKIGAIAFDSEGPVAACFLRKIESCNYALVDGLISDPKSSGKRRYYALNAVSAYIIGKAKEIGMKQILAYTEDAGTLKRSKGFSFAELPHTMMVLNLVK